MKMLPDEIDQMKLFQLIQIVPTPTRSALASGNFEGYRISDPRIMGYLRNNSMFTFGKADRAKTSATFREILDAMWLFNDKFERARARCSRRSRLRRGAGAITAARVTLLLLLRRGWRHIEDMLPAWAGPAALLVVTPTPSPSPQGGGGVRLTSLPGLSAGGGINPSGHVDWYLWRP